MSRSMNRIENINNTISVKQDDTGTVVQLKIYDYDGNPVDLKNPDIDKIEVKIGAIGRGFHTIKIPTLLDETGALEFRLDVDDKVPAGTNDVEVHVYYKNGRKRIFPAEDAYKLKVSKSLDAVGKEVFKVTVDYLLEQFDNKKQEIEDEAAALREEIENAIQYVDESITEVRQEFNEQLDQTVDNKMTPLVEVVNEHLAEKVTLASYQPIKKVRYIAHRGMSAIAPENTIPAYELAGELGMWGAECDAITTKDGVWVLMHDDTVDRTTNGTGKVSDFTLDEIKNLKIDAGNNIELYPNLRVPTLEEYLITCKKYGLVPVIEIKSASKNSDYDTFVNLIKKYGYEENCIVISFSLTALQEVRLRSKKIVIQYLADISETTINQVRELRNAGLDVNYTFLTKEKIELAHSNGLMVNAWTVNSVQTAKNLIDFGVDYITTDVLIEVI